MVPCPCHHFIPAPIIDCISANSLLIFTFAALMAAASFVSLVKKDLLMEWRQKHALFGVLLYVGATVFVVYMMNGQPEARVWNALFWLTQLFVAVNSMAKSFLQEHPHRFRYYYTIVKPATFLLAKMVYSTVLMLIMCTISLVLYGVMLGWPLVNSGLFIVIALTGSLSLSVVFTFLSAIAARAQQNSSLMAILGFPLVTPVLMILSKLAATALQPIYMPGWWNLAIVLVFMDVLIVFLGLILFPFLWQE
jgi:heme exporter protein B